MTDFEKMLVHSNKVDEKVNKYSNTSYEKLLEERSLIADEIREIHEKNLPQDQLDLEMWCLDRRMEDVEDMILSIELRRD